jgi:hypothetical protein
LKIRRSAALALADGEAEPALDFGDEGDDGARARDADHIGVSDNVDGNDRDEMDLMLKALHLQFLLKALYLLLKALYLLLKAMHLLLQAMYSTSC